MGSSIAGGSAVVDGYHNFRKEKNNKAGMNYRDERVVMDQHQQHEENGDEVEDFLNKPHVKAVIGVGAAATLCGEFMYIFSNKVK